ncbi:type II secretion system F family protein [Myxococcota bacterium]|nr:type II secretion system F family protein [Myxococcota bacterium]
MTLAFASMLLLLSAASVWMALTNWNSARAAFEDRLRRLQGPAGAVLVPRRRPVSVLDALVARLAPQARVLLPGQEDEMREKLAQAGWRGPHAAEAYLAAQVALSVGLPAIYLTGAFWSHTEGLRMVAAMMALTALGFGLPGTVVARRGRARQKELQRSLPEALDLLVTCVEAGLGLDSALHKVADELELNGSPLGTELRITHLEIAAGITRVEALQRMARRTGVEDIRALVAVLVQTERFGTSVAHALRTQAESLRVRRQLRAEEEAGQSPVKLSAILVVFLVPCLVMVVLSGAVVRVYHSLLHGSLGG